MAVFSYSRVAAYNPNTSPTSVARSASGSVYDIGDTGFLTPLNLTLVATNTVTTTLVSDANAMFPDFTLVDRTSCVFKSGSTAMVLTTTTPIPGPTGSAGTAGKSIASAALSAGNLVLTLSDSTTLAPVPLPTGAAIDDSSAAYLVGNGPLTTGALNATFVPKWKATTAYLAGDKVLSPGGDVVSAKVNFTSGASYSAANWDLSASYALPADVALKAKLTSLVRPSATFRTSNPNRTMLATFQSGHGFSQAVTSSYNYNDTTDFVLGSQSAYIVTNGAGGQAIITKSAAVSSLNMTGKVFAVLLKVTNLIHLNRITVLAGSGGFANNFQIQVQASNTLTDQEITPEGRWVWVTLPWNPSATGGTPDRTAITDLRIAAVDDNTGNLVKVQVQAIATQAERPAAFPNGVMSIGFDDNWISQSTVAIPYLDRKGFSPTVYSIVDLVGTAGRQTLDQLKRIEEYSGGEVAAHAWTNATHTLGFTGVTTDVLDNELKLMKEWLIDNNFQGRDLLAYPLGNFNANVMDIAAKYYKFARTVNIRQQETLPPGGALTCRAQSNTNATTLAQITAQIDKAQANGSWLNLLYHDIVATPGATPGSVQVTQANFEGAIDYATSVGIPVRTVSQVLKATAP